MTTPHVTVVYDVDDCKVYPLLSDPVGGSATYGAAVDVPGIQQVSLDPNFVTQQLKGDAKVIDRKGRIDTAAINIQFAELSLDVLAVLLDGTVTDASGSAKFAIKGANGLPYFKIVFRISDNSIGVGSVITTVYKAQLTGGSILGGQTDNYGTPTAQISGIPLDSTDDFFDVELFDDLTALPA